MNDKLTNPMADSKEAKRIESSTQRNKEVSRRNFLKAGLTGAAALGFTGLNTDVQAKDDKAAKKTPGIPYKRGWTIDAFCHILPPKYLQALAKKVSGPPPVFSVGRYGLPPLPALVDLETRLRIMDRYDSYVQIINISLPPPEDVLSPRDAIEVAKIGNDSMAEIIYKYPDRFIAATACLPLNDMDEAMKELDRAVNELGFRGVQITSTIMDKPLDSPEFQPLFEKMAYYNLPIQIHPRTMKGGTRFLEETGIPKDLIGMWAQTPFNWPFETTIAVGRLVFSGLFEKYPNLKVLTHHLGGFVPYHIERVTHFTDNAQTRLGGNLKPRGHLTRPYADYYKMIYADTACYGATPALMCGHAFFGAEHVLFGTDFPFDNQGGNRLIRETMRSVDEMDITVEEKKEIFEDNAKKIFRLPI